MDIFPFFIARKPVRVPAECGWIEIPVIPEKERWNE